MAFFFRVLLIHFMYVCVRIYSQIIHICVIVCPIDTTVIVLVVLCPTYCLCLSSLTRVSVQSGRDEWILFWGRILTFFSCDITVTCQKKFVMNMIL